MVHESLADALALEETNVLRDQFRDRDIRKLVPVELVVCPPGVDPLRLEAFEAARPEPRIPTRIERALTIAAGVILALAALALVLAAGAGL